MDKNRVWWIRYHIFSSLQCSCDNVAGDAGHDVPPGPVQSLADSPPLPPLALRLAGRHGDRSLSDDQPPHQARHHHLAQHHNHHHLLLLHHLRVLPLHRQDVLHSQTVQLHSIQVIFILAVDNIISAVTEIYYQLYCHVNCYLSSWGWCWIARKICCIKYKSTLLGNNLM